MNALKEKVTERLSRLFADSPPNSSSPSPPLDNSQAQSYSKEGKSLFSLFSHVLPSTSSGGFQSNKHQDDIKPLYHRLSNEISEGQCEAADSCQDYSQESKHKESLNTREKYKECIPASDNKETLKNHKEDEDHDSARSSDSDVFEEATEPNSPEKPVPSLTGDSCFISPDLYEFLQSSLPNIVKGCQWILLYSTLKHGISLRTLIRKSTDLSGPSVLIVGDRQGAVFGGLLECPLRPTAKRKYQGTNQTFVFTTIYGEPRLFRPTGANRYYYLCLNDLLALGGGGNFALCLDGDLLTGTSGPCETFGNLCLAHNPEFELKNVELWGFTHASQYLT